MCFRTIRLHFSTRTIFLIQYFIYNSISRAISCVIRRWKRIALRASRRLDHDRQVIEPELNLLNVSRWKCTIFQREWTPRTNNTEWPFYVPYAYVAEKRKNVSKEYRKREKEYRILAAVWSRKGQLSYSALSITCCSRPVMQLLAQILQEDTQAEFKHTQLVIFL